MHARWKIVGGAGIAGLGILLLIVGRSREVSGDTSPSSTSAAPNHNDVDADGTRNPLTPYPLGPGSITYEQLNAASKGDVDVIQERTETSQPPSSYTMFSQGAEWAGQEAERQRAERGVGLVGVEQDGVVP